MNILRYASPTRWRNFIDSRVELMKRDRGDNELDAAWGEIGPLKLSPGGRTLVADGLWHNPGFFLRLRLFIEAVGRTQPLTLLGVLRSRSDHRQRRALERIGFSKFVYIDEDDEFPITAFEGEAARLLAPVKSHRDLLQLELPEGLPAYIWYDTVLKNTSHGQPSLDHPEWKRSLAEILAYMAIYKRLFADNDVGNLAVSHAWKSEWGALLWCALKRDVPSYCVTHYSEAIRIRRFNTLKDFDLPVEHLPVAVFDRASPGVKRALVDFGYAELQRRQSNQSSDVNIRFAYDLSKRVNSRAEARQKLGVDDDQPIGVIYGHAWFDFPHLYGMANFTDFVDWFQSTVEAIRKIDHVRWFLKPHPMEVWYGGHRMKDMIGELPPHISVLPHEIDTLTVMKAADAIVSVHGTSTLEAVAGGTTVICADRSYYSDWGFAHVAKSRDEYPRILAQVGKLPRPDQATRDRAAACFVGAYGEPHETGGALRIPCDSGGAQLFVDIRQMVVTAPSGLEREVDRLAAFLEQTSVDSFESWTFVHAAEQQAAATLEPQRKAEDARVNV